MNICRTELVEQNWAPWVDYNPMVCLLFSQKVEMSQRTNTPFSCCQTDSQQWMTIFSCRLTETGLSPAYSDWLSTVTMCASIVLCIHDIHQRFLVYVVQSAETLKEQSQGIQPTHSFAQWAPSDKCSYTEPDGYHIAIDIISASSPSQRFSSARWFG